MDREDEYAVRVLHALCHPGAVDRPLGWYIAHPTLVVTENLTLIGYTSCTVVLIPGFGQTMYGMDVAVHPGHRKKGVAARLHQARLALARDIGVRVFMGATSDPGMAKVLMDAGAHACLPVGDETLYVGAIGGD